MSRFGNLEFGSGSDESVHNESAELKGEAHYLSQALGAFQNGEFETALRMYGRILEHNAQNTAAWSGQVRMLIELQEFKEASLWADKALQQFPSDPEMLAAKAVALARLGDLSGAITFSDAAIAEEGELPYVWLARADVLLARKEQRADYCFEKARNLAPKSWFVLWLAARIRAFYREFSRALQLLKEAVELHPGHFFLWFEMGQCQEALGLVGPAQFSYRQALELNPGCSARHAIAQISSAGLTGRFRAWARRLFKS